METKHTPGPWMIRPTGCVGTGRMMTACVYPMEDTHPEENLANARLIAAAPEMLQVLQQLLEERSTLSRHDRVLFLDEHLDTARALVAKATGSAASASSD